MFRRLAVVPLLLVTACSSEQSSPPSSQASSPQSPPPGIVADTFSAPATTPISGLVPETTVGGGAWQVFATGSGSPGAPTIQASQFTPGGAVSTAGYAEASVNAGVADVAVAADILGDAAKTWGGVVVRQTDGQNFIAGIVSGSTAYIFRVDAGTWTQLTFVAVGGAANSGSHRIEMRTSGPSIELWLDGVKQLQVTEPFQATATRHGLVWQPYNAATSFDNFSINVSKPTS